MYVRSVLTFIHNPVPNVYLSIVYFIYNLFHSVDFLLLINEHSIYIPLILDILLGFQRVRTTVYV